jgi:hypothetical protein
MKGDGQTKVFNSEDVSMEETTNFTPDLSKMNQFLNQFTMSLGTHQSFLLPQREGIERGSKSLQVLELSCNRCLLWTALPPKRIGTRQRS